MMHRTRKLAASQPTSYKVVKPSIISTFTARSAITNIKQQCHPPLAALKSAAAKPCATGKLTIVAACLSSAPSNLWCSGEPAPHLKLADTVDAAYSLPRRPRLCWNLTTNSKITLTTTLSIATGSRGGCSRIPECIWRFALSNALSGQDNIVACCLMNVSWKSGRGRRQRPSRSCCWEGRARQMYTNRSQSS